MVLEDMVFKAISHPVRREIIGLLAIAPRSVKELTAKFEISQPAISQQLEQAIRRARLAASGNWDYCGLASSQPREARLCPISFVYIENRIPK
jgi:DNA-binding transcriptional ArsR family regulator